MEAELRRIAGQYFAPETIESVRVFNRRAMPPKTRPERKQWKRLCWHIRK